MSEINAASIFGGPDTTSSSPVNFTPFPVTETVTPVQNQSPSAQPIATPISTTQGQLPVTQSPFPGEVSMNNPAPVQSQAPVFTAPAAQAPMPVQQERIYQAGNDDFQFGKKVNRWPINRFKGIAERVQRISILELAAWDGKRVHYLEAVKSYMYCFGGSCCKSGSLANVNYFGPIVVYTTSPDGMNVIDKKFSVEFMSLSDEKYNNLLTIWGLLKNRNSSLDQVDLLVTGKTKNTGQRTFVDISFMEAGPAIWRQYPEFGNAIWAEYQKLKSFIPTSFARSMGSTLEECEANYAKAMASKGQSGNNNQAVAPAVNTAFNLGQLANPNMGSQLK